METRASAGALLREARRTAGLSQTELAGLAGVTQSVISAYEAGRRQPSWPALTRLIDATGNDVEMVLKPHSSRLRRLRGPIGRKVRARRSELRDAAARYDVSNLRVFGSVARGEESEHSDVDLLVDLPAEVGLFTLARLQRQLESILHARVDIVPAGDLKPGVRPNIERDAVPL